MTAKGISAPLDAGVLGREEGVADTLGQPPPVAAPARFFDVALDDIMVPADWRPVDERAVQHIVDSVRDIGPQPQFAISVQWAPAGSSQRCILVAGRHRLEAARWLKWPMIPATIFEGDAIEAKMWRITENLARAELSVLEKAEQISQWEALRAEKHGHGAQGTGGDPRVHGGLSEAARAINMDRRTLRRFRGIAGLSDAAKSLIAANAGLDNSRDLEVAARLGGADAQVEYLQGLLDTRESARREKTQMRKQLEGIAAKLVEAEVAAIKQVVTIRPIGSSRSLSQSEEPQPPGVKSSDRSDVLMRVTALLDIDPGRALADLLRLMRDQRGEIIKLPNEKRIALARGFLTTLGLTWEDLKPLLH